MIRALLVFIFALVPSATFALGGGISCWDGDEPLQPQKPFVITNRSNHDEIIEEAKILFRAQKHSSNPKCLNLGLFEKTCAAVASYARDKKYTEFYLGTSPDINDATHAALAQCELRHGSSRCAIAQYACDGLPLRISEQPTPVAKQSVQPKSIPEPTSKSLSDLTIPPPREYEWLAIIVIALAYFAIGNYRRHPYLIPIGIIAIGMAVPLAALVSILLKWLFVGGRTLSQAFGIDWVSYEDIAIRYVVLSPVVATFGYYFGRALPQGFPLSVFEGTQPTAKDKSASQPVEPKSSSEQSTAVTTTTEPQPVELPRSLAPNTPPQLKMKRSQRETGIMGKTIFMLDARMEVNADDAALIKKQKLDKEVIYESSARKKHKEAAAAHAESTSDMPSMLAPPGEQAKGALKSLYKLGRAGVSAAIAGLSLRITVGSLLAGVHVECKDMAELLEAENAMVEAGKNLKGYLESLRSFDGGEAIIDL